MKRREFIKATAALAVSASLPQIGRTGSPSSLGPRLFPTNLPNACRFHTRCPKFVAGHCDVDEPVLESKQGGNVAACHYPLTDQEIASRVPTAAA